MIGHLGLQRSFQNRFGQLLEQTVFPDHILGLLVVGEQLINQLLVDCHGVFHFLPPIAVYTVLFTPSAPAEVDKCRLSAPAATDPAAVPAALRMLPDSAHLHLRYLGLLSPFPRPSPDSSACTPCQLMNGPS